MQILRRITVPLFLIMMVCAVSVYFYVGQNDNVMVSGEKNTQKTVIIDAGHGGLTNTIH